jgi:UDP-glucuronate 4-epimerase
MEQAERFLVTGALGCIGAWTVRLLVDEGVAVVAADVAGDPHRWRLLDPELEHRAPLVRSDVADGEGFERLLVDHGITHVVHLAALQVPFARAQPALGARVNVEGMAVVLEAARRLREQVRGLAFASSIAVYRPDGGEAGPTTLYGAYKLADEWMARVYWLDHGVASMGLRPAVVYGPGRDQGLTSGPSRAMLAAAVGRPFHVEWGGMAGYHHAADVAAAFVAAARASAGAGGGETYDLPVQSCSMDDMVAAIEEAAGAAAAIDFEPVQLPFPSELDASALEARLGPVRLRPLREGVRETVETFRGAAADGRLDVARVLGP